LAVTNFFFWKIYTN